MLIDLAGLIRLHLQCKKSAPIACSPETLAEKLCNLQALRRGGVHSTSKTWKTEEASAGLLAVKSRACGTSRLDLVGNVSNQRCTALRPNPRGVAHPVQPKSLTSRRHGGKLDT